MTKDEFLRELEDALRGSISPSAVNENIRYYDEYIDTEVRKGRSENEVMEELGDPRLIAKTIIDTAVPEEKRGAERIYDEESHAGPLYGEDGSRERDYRSGFRYTRVSGAKALLVLAVILLIFFAIFTLAVFLVGSFIAAFWPAILVAVVLWWILNPLGRG